MIQAGKETLTSPTPFTEGQEIVKGVNLILQALAVSTIDNLSTPGEVIAMVPKLEELIPRTRDHFASLLSLRVVGAPGVDTFSFRDYGSLSDSEILWRLQKDLLATFIEMSRYTELLKQTPVVIVAGEQGSGKDTLAPIFTQARYTSVPMSSMVQAVACAWELDPNETMSKIVVGQVLKEYFEDGILTTLGIYNAVRQGAQRVVLFGPKVIGEVEAAIKSGGKLIGIIADPNPLVDYQIRRQRVTGRALQNSTRMSDVERFDARESIEHPKIQQILQYPGCFLIINNYPSIQDYLTNATGLLEEII